MDSDSLKKESRDAEWYYRVSFGGSWEDFKTLPEVLTYIENKFKLGNYVSIRNVTFADYPKKQNAKTTTENKE